MAGRGTGTLPGARALYLPLRAAQGKVGVLGVRSEEADGAFAAKQLYLLETFANQLALAIERRRVLADTQQAKLQAETERLRSALLSSVSHDLRTPLAAITGAASSLRDGSRTLPESVREELADTIAEEAMRLNRLIGNLLDMTRLESGTLAPRKEWYSLEEVVGAALTRLEPALQDRAVRLNLPDDLPLVPLDGVLFEQVVWNLVENAIKYTPAGGSIEISAGLHGGELRFDVADRGPGIGSGDEHRLFEKFYRGESASGQPGVGLGLSICEAIVRAHGGTIEAANRAGGGAVFTVWLPLEGGPAARPDRLPEEEPAEIGT
jgi:two-component system sensor histidine kinase KdpD